MSRVALASIKTLTFYNSAQTKAVSRRGLPPIPQLTCVGNSCSLYQPEAVRCTNEGGEGAEVEWKCEADLPESLRFGRVEVSCEGWGYSGDPYVLKGSCGLRYRLVRVPDLAEGSNLPSRFSRWFESADVGATLFMFLWASVLLFLLYHLLKSCLEGGSAATTGRPSPRRRPPSDSTGGFFDAPPNDAPPPPYSATPKSPSQYEARFWPGFWTGLGLGGLGATAAAQYYRNRNRPASTSAEAHAYDWERDRVFPSRSSAFVSNDRGEGSSNLGSMRRATGIGGSNVR